MLSVVVLNRVRSIDHLTAMLSIANPFHTICTLSSDRFIAMLECYGYFHVNRVLSGKRSLHRDVEYWSSFITNNDLQMGHCTTVLSIIFPFLRKPSREFW